MASASLPADLLSMDLSDPLSLFSSLILGVIGTGMIIYAKKQQQLAPGLVGVVLCLVPCFITSVLADWLIAIACMGGLYALSRHG